MTCWVCMHDKSDNGYGGVYVIDKPKYITPAASLKKGDQVAIYVGGKNNGPRAVVALVEITQKIKRFSTIDKKGRTWLQIANTKTIGKDGWCSLDDLLQILAPKREFKNNKAKGSYLTGRCACTVSPINRDEFNEIGNYFADYHSQLKRLENISADAPVNEEDSYGQGFASAKERNIIEEYAIRKAAKWLEYKGFNNINNCSKNNSYDLSCSKNGQTYYVEVKGTRSDGASVIITHGEKCYAEKHNNVILFLVSKINLKKGGKKASGGIEQQWNPWNLEEGNLFPISYRYKLPQ